MNLRLILVYNVTRNGLIFYADLINSINSYPDFSFFVKSFDIQFLFQICFETASDNIHSVPLIVFHGFTVKFKSIRIWNLTL